MSGASAHLSPFTYVSQKYIVPPPMPTADAPTSVFSAAPSGAACDRRCNTSLAGGTFLAGTPLNSFITRESRRAVQV